MLSPEDFTVENSEFLIRQGWRVWSNDETFEGKMLLLCPVSQFANVPDGTRMTDVFGKHCVKGVDKINQDGRVGMLGYGILLEMVNMPDKRKKFRSIDDS